MTLRTNLNENRLTLAGTIQLEDLPSLLAALAALAPQRRRDEDGVEMISAPSLGIDLSQCGPTNDRIGADPAVMAAMVAQISKLRSVGFNIDVVIPRELPLRNLFVRSNWAHFLDGRQFTPSSPDGDLILPLSQFTSDDERAKLLNQTIEALLRTVNEFSRGDFAAVEWALAEMTDNVMVHSESPVGGFLQVATAVDQMGVKGIHVVVADAGVGIPRTLMAGQPDVRTEPHALELAIRRGVTRDPMIGQGNGLFGCYEIAQRSGGDFAVHSGEASLASSMGDVQPQREVVAYTGTLIVSRMPYPKPDVLADALQFDGLRWVPSDYLELNLGLETGAALRIALRDQSKSFSSREAGRPVRQKLLNFLTMNDGPSSLVVDLSDVPFASSSFADEALGKLVLDLGAAEVAQRVHIEGGNDFVRAIVGRALTQRARQQ